MTEPVELKTKKRRTWAIAIQLLIVLLMLVFEPSHSGAQAGGFTISGSVSMTGTSSTWYPDAANVYVKLVQGGIVLKVVQPDTIFGTYTITGVSNGTYSVVISNNSLSTDATASRPTTYSFSSPLTGTTAVTVNNANVSNINFTLQYACFCGYADGRLTTKTIPMTTTGDLSAWGDVTQDSDNNACDSTSPDRDAPIQSTGRDLLQFSYTWDSSNLYGFTTRVASDSNTDNFIYYADTNNNGLMEKNEPVIYVSWQGSNRNVNVGVGQYSPKAAGGDPLNSATTGFADGFKMPGTISNGSLLYSGAWGSNSGTAMQWFVHWSDLFTADSAGNMTRLSGPTVIRWHISSTNSTPTAASLPSQIDDDMGGCGGCAASNQYGGVNVSGSSTAAGNPGTTIYIPQTITNAGNGNDTFSFSTTTSGGWTPTSITYYKDVGTTVGQFDAGDQLTTNSGILTPGQSLNILIALAVPAGAAAGIDNVQFTASSSFIALCGAGPPATQTVTDTARVGWIISGFGYADANHNGTRDTTPSTEAGTGVTLYAKLLNSSNAWVATATVDPTTGAYAFPPELAGTYSVILSNNNLITSLTPSYPTGWIPTSPSPSTLSVTTTSTDVPNKNLGIYNGSSVSLTAFNDIGGTSATANNGIQDNATSEIGLASVTIAAKDSTLATTYMSGSTDASGKLLLYVPAAATTLTIQKTPIANTQATGGTVGTSGGTYQRGNETITGIAVAAGNQYTGLSFGSVPINTFTSAHTSTMQAGTFVLYPHTFTAGTRGTVTFTSSASLSIPQTAWTETIYSDANCNGVIDGTDAVISGAQTIAAPGNFCVIFKEAVPAGASGTNTVTLSANFTYTNAPGGLSAALTNVDATTAGYTISGFVYNDLNHNSTFDNATENGTGVTLYAKLIQVVSGTPTVIDVASVSTATSGGSGGSYTFGANPKPVGNYTVVLSTNNLTADTSVIIPTGWIGTQNVIGSIAITIASADATGQNFGLFNGSKLSGIVFNDSGVGSGTPNNGLQDGTEAGIAGVTVSATNSGNTTTYDSMTTPASGAFTLWITASAGANTVIRKTTAASYPVAINGNAGTTAGVYARATETVTFTNVSGTSYTGIKFGDVAANTFTNDGTQSTAVGTTIYYPHTFTANSGGVARFTSSAVPTPSQTAWTEAIFIDADCSQTFTPGDTAYNPASPPTMSSAQSICILLQETVPAAATGINTVTVSAAFTYTNSIGPFVSTLTHTDTTTTGTPPNITLTKVVDKQSVFPGDTISYTITYTNIGSFSALNVSIQDTIPNFTTFVSASCGTPPTGITACAVSSPSVGAAGTVVWTMTGSLSAGSSGSVNMKVKLQ